jgi:metal-responsive CopG/Arc/MetJ family transcriptional regulator
MAKFALPKVNDKGTRSSIRIPRAMLRKMDDAMALAGYNKKQRSRWIEDLTHIFLNRSDAANLIAEEFIVPGSTEAIPVTLSQDLDTRISDVLERVLLEESIKKDRSSVLRTAITQQLLALSGAQLSPEETRQAKVATKLLAMDSPQQDGHEE